MRAAHRVRLFPQRAGDDGEGEVVEGGGGTDGNLLRSATLGRGLRNREHFSKDKPKT